MDGKKNDKNRAPAQLKNNYRVETLFGFQDLGHVVRKLKPDLLVSFNDNLVLDLHLKIVNQVKEGQKLDTACIPYMPIDVENLPGKNLTFLNQCEHILTMTEFCKKVLIGSGVSQPVEVLYHPMQTDKYFPLSEEQNLNSRRQHFGTLYDNAFIVLNCNRNQSRKRIDLTLEAFAQWVSSTGKKKGEVLLILKMSEHPSLIGGGLKLKESIAQLTKKYQIKFQDYIALNDQKLTQEALNELYNLSDAGINTTSGEGFGIIPAECALTLQPQIVPNAGTYPELFDGFELVETEELSFGQGREGENLSKLEPEAFVFYKSYSSYLNVSHSLIEQFEVDQDEQMAYYLISEKGQDTEEQKPFRVTQASGVQMTVLGHFKTLAYLQAWISDLKSVPNRFQVYLTYGKEFADLRAQMNYLNELDNKPFLHLENRASQQLPLNKIESVLNEWDVKVRVCKVPALVEKLEQLYSDPSLRMQIAEKHSNSIKEKCSPQVIAQQFYEFLEKVR